jgi:hypothetical protein
MQPVLRLVSHNDPEHPGTGSLAPSPMTDEQVLDTYSQAVMSERSERRGQNGSRSNNFRRNRCIRLSDLIPKTPRWLKK